MKIVNDVVKPRTDIDGFRRAAGRSRSVLLHHPSLRPGRTKPGRTPAGSNLTRSNSAQVELGRVERRRRERSPGRTRPKSNSAGSNVARANAGEFGDDSIYHLLNTKNAAPTSRIAATR